MIELISTYLSEDRSKASMVYLCETGYKVVCVKSYLGEEETHYFNILQRAELFAEDWVF